jgi:hypothetical protein
VNRHGGTGHEGISRGWGDEGTAKRALLDLSGNASGSDESGNEDESNGGC